MDAMAEISLPMYPPAPQRCFGKVCLICSCDPDFHQHGFSYGEEPSSVAVDHCVFLLDLDADVTADGDAYLPRNPDMSFSAVSLRIWGCCVADSTLYFFGMEKELLKYKLSPPPPPPHSSSSSSSRQIPLPREVLLLTMDMLTVGPPMNFPKYDLVACQTPDGRRMLVLSASISAANVNSGKFELFDIASEHWITLPDLLPLLLSKDVQFSRRPKAATTFRVRSYSFIDDTDDLLIITSVGNFVLKNVTRIPSCEWSECGGFQFRLSDFPCLMLVKHGLCLMDWCAYVDGDRSRQKLPYPWLASGDYSYCNSGSGMTWLSPDLFCVARVHVDPKSRRPHLIVDVCSFDSVTFSRRKKDVAETDGGLTAVPVDLIKSFKFVVGPQELLLWFIPEGLFTIP